MRPAAACGEVQQRGAGQMCARSAIPPLCLLQDMSQLLENVFADPKGFGIAADGRYRFQLPGFTSGTAQVS